MATLLGDMFKRLLYQEISGKDVGLPADALGPTGNVFMHQGSYSTHLNASDDEKMFPMLVPNQIGVDSLLMGGKATREQYERAQASATRDPKSTVPFPPGVKGNSPEAAAFEKTWHDAEAAKTSDMFEVIRRIRGAR
jgi:hypothetical protein